MSKTFRGETLVGKQFNNWKVLEFVPNDKKGGYWKCECQCSLKTQKTIEGDRLKKGAIASCGCLRGNNLLNQRFGKLIVIERTEERKSDKVIWKCLCDCGETTFVRSDYLANGTTKSCGCLKKVLIHDLSGQRFGRLLVLERTESYDNRETCWKCKCDCGAIKNVASYSLTAGITQSCGCLNSIGEYNIAKLLTENNIAYIPQYKFNDLVSPKNCKLSFDFAIFEDNSLSYLIEFDGPQHEIISGGWNTPEKFQKTQEYDKLKNDYCKNNNIPLIRIPYKMRDSITFDLLLLENNPFLMMLM